MGREDFINMCVGFQNISTETSIQRAIKLRVFCNQSIANNTKLHIPDLKVFHVNGVEGAAKDPSREFLWKLLSQTHGDGLI